MPFENGEEGEMHTHTHIKGKFIIELYQNKEKNKEALGTKDYTHQKQHHNSIEFHTVHSIIIIDVYAK